MIAQASCQPARAESSLRGSSASTCEQAEPEKQGTAGQERDDPLNRDPALVAWKEQQEETTEQHVETDAQEPTQPVLERAAGLEPVAGLAGRTLQVLSRYVTRTSVIAALTAMPQTRSIYTRSRSMSVRHFCAAALCIPLSS